MDRLRSWRKSKPGSHTREIVKELTSETLPDEFIRRLESLEDDVRAILATLAKAPGKTGEIVVPVVSDLLDRIAALEQLVIESMTAPKALSDHLRLMSEVMQAMDERFTTMRNADQKLLDLHRQASEQTASAQGGLAAVVESMKVDMEALSGQVAMVKNQISKRDQYTAQIVKRGRAS